MAIRFIVTDAGRAALTNDDNTGTGARQIAEIGLGRGQYEAGDRSRTELVEPIKRIDTIAGETVAPDIIHVTLQDETNDTYSVGEIGLFLDNGVLFAYYSQPDDWIIEKAAPSTLLLATDIEIADIDVSSLTFGDAAFLNPPATTEVKGVIELATQEEVDAGTDRLRAVVPRTLKALLDKVLAAYATMKQLTDHAASRDHPDATTTAKGFVELATYGETQDGIDNARAVTPAALNARTATTSRTGLVERATDAEAKAGADGAVVPSVAQVFMAFGQLGLGVTSQPTWPLASFNDNPLDVPSGIYRLTSTVDGTPQGSGTVIWMRYSGAQYGAAIFLPYDGVDIYTRAYRWDTGWKSWNAQYGENNFPVATQAQAVEGASNEVYLSALRGMQMIQAFGIGVTTQPTWPLDDLNADPTGVPSGIYRITSGFNRPGGSATVVWTRYNNGSGVMQLTEPDDPTLRVRGFGGAGWSGWFTMWNNQNHGAGSGMDADLLDGQHGSFYRDADNLNSGTVPLARLTSASETERGILQIATSDEAKAGSTNGRTMTPARVADYVTQFGLGAAAPDGNGLFGSNFNTFIQRDIIVTCSGVWQNGPDGNASIAGILVNLSRVYTNQVTQIVIDGARKFWRSGSPSAGTWDSWRLDWNNQNHGAGSGMDADLLDGQHGSFYRDAGNLNSGTVPIARLTSASETERGILQIATSAEAKAGSTNGRTMTPARVSDYVGQFGIGVTQNPNWPYVSMNSTPSSNLPTGLYRVTAGVNNRPADSGVVLVTRYNGSLVGLVYFDNTGRTFTRTYNGSWSAWAESWAGQTVAQGFAQQGYQLLPSGLLIQWGRSGDAVPTGGSVTLSLATTYPNTLWSVFPSIYRTDNSATDTNSVSWDYSSNSRIVLRNNSQAPRTLHYLAVGN